MAFKKNDKVIVVSKNGDTYSSEVDEVTSVSGGQISLSKKSGKFKSTGKHTSENMAIIPLSDYTQSAFVRSGTVQGVRISREKIDKILKDAK